MAEFTHHHGTAASQAGGAEKDDSRIPAAPGAPENRPVSARLAGLVMIVVALAGGGWSARSLYLDFLLCGHSLERYSQAAAIDAGNASIYRGLADLDPSHRRENLIRAVELEPFDAGSMVELGLIDEIDGKPRSAERWLLGAARVDRTYLTAWTLANYYFRQGNEAAFWSWARRAAGMSPNDLHPLFQLCFLTTNDAGKVERLVVAGRPLAERRFLTYLIHTGRLDDTASLLKGHSGRLLREQPDAARAFVGTALEAGRTREAREIWDAISSLGLTGLAPVNSGAGGYVTNGSFEREISGNGFDWRGHPGPGIAIYRDRDETSGRRNVVRLELSANVQHRNVLEQYLSLPPGRHLRLSWRGRASGLGLDSQVLIAIRFDGGPGSSLEQRVLENTEEWKKYSWSFETPPNFRTARLILLHSSRGLPLSPAVVVLTGLKLTVEPADPNSP
jgi:hypothetical protein